MKSFRIPLPRNGVAFAEVDLRSWGLGFDFSWYITPWLHVQIACFSLSMRKNLSQESGR